ERKPGRIIGIAESFQTQPSSHQNRIPQDSEYSSSTSRKKAGFASAPASAACVSSFAIWAFHSANWLSNFSNLVSGVFMCLSPW
ncbi:hypothetical protein, partial [Sulfitobacter brevis]|uniref:hypothetical protein n=1 Tax=Sulfitobacter brevis TaxID=74348 RepID=UPI001C4357F0